VQHAFRIALVLAVACHQDSPCERAVARIERVSRHPTSERGHDFMIEGCRNPGPHTFQDPVLRCAMDSPTDEAAAACIDAFTKAVVRPSVGSDSGGGKGLNPLLDP
jgi:hypothetical protein